MPLLPCQKDFIDAAIFCELDHFSESESIHDLKKHTQDMYAYLTNRKSSDLPLICKFFHQPTLISRLEEFGPVLIGEVRLYLLISIETAIDTAAKRWNLSKEDLDWHGDKVIELTKKEQNHNKAFLSDQEVSNILAPNPMINLQAHDLMLAIETLRPIVPREELRQVLLSLQYHWQVQQFVTMADEISRQNNLRPLHLNRYQLFPPDEQPRQVEPDHLPRQRAGGCCVIS